MLKIKQAIIVEGKYDKIKLSSIVDATIIQTDGFRIFKDKAVCEMIKKLSLTCGIIVLTDSDVAGFKIRNFIKSITQNKNVTNIFIPDIFGKEKRKAISSKEGKLGVEGMPVEILLKAFENASINCQQVEEDKQKITKMDFFEDGLVGGQKCSELRKKLLFYLELPEHLSSNALVEVINSLLSFDEYKDIIKKLS